MKETLRDLRRLAEEQDAKEYLRLRWEFHATCYRASGRERLVDEVGRLYWRAYRYNRLVLSTAERFRESVGRYRDFLAACEAGDGERAEQVVQESIRWAVERALPGSRPSRRACERRAGRSGRGRVPHARTQAVPARRRHRRHVHRRRPARRRRRRAHRQGAVDAGRLRARASSTARSPCSPSLRRRAAARSPASSTPPRSPRTRCSRARARARRSSRRGLPRRARDAPPPDPGALRHPVRRARRRSSPAGSATRSTERLGPRGERWAELDEASVREVAERSAQRRRRGGRDRAAPLLRRRRRTSGAVEEIVRAAVGDGVYVTRSSEILPEIREYERTSTAVVNAYVGPAITPLPRARSSTGCASAGIGARSRSCSRAAAR